MFCELFFYTLWRIMKITEYNHLSLETSNSGNIKIDSYAGPRDAYKVYTGNFKIFKSGKNIDGFSIESIYPFLKSLENHITMDEYILYYSYDSAKLAKELLRLTSNENENSIFMVSLPSQTLIQLGLIKRSVIGGNQRNIPCSYTAPERQLVYTFKPKFNRFFRDTYYRGICIYD